MRKSERVTLKKLVASVLVDVQLLTDQVIGLREQIAEMRSSDERRHAQAIAVNMENDRLRRSQNAAPSTS